MKKSQSKLKSPRVKKKLRMNEHEISIHVNNSRIQILQSEFTTWKYKVKLGAEVASGGVLLKSCS